MDHDMSKLCVGLVWRVLLLDTSKVLANFKLAVILFIVVLVHCHRVPLSSLVVSVGVSASP
eukprot:2463427-Amphidinium_carterae.1